MTVLPDLERALVRAAERESVESAIEAECRARRRSAGETRRRGSRRVRRGMVVAVGLSLTAAVVVALLPAGVNSPGLPSSAVAARACLVTDAQPAGRCLRAIGDVAAAQQALGDGQILYQRDLTAYSIKYIGRDGRGQASPDGPRVYGIVRAITQEIWVSPDRSGRISYAPTGRPYLPSAADERAWEAAGRPDIDRLAGPVDARDNLPPQSFKPGAADTWLLGGGQLRDALPPDDPLKDTPIEPAALEQYLMRIAWYQRTTLSGEGPCAPDLHDCAPATQANIRSVFGSDITQLLSYPFTPPDLRRALFEVFARLSGTRLLGRMRDSLGRTGAAILLPDGINDGLNVVVFDPVTARLIADGRAERPSVDYIRWHTLHQVATGHVARVGDRPESVPDATLEVAPADGR